MAKIAKTVKSKAKKAPAKRKMKAVASVKRAGSVRRAKSKVTKTVARKAVRKSVKK
jgi:hypothetical protein